jgi:O-succinylbenzoate synthase
MIYQFQFKPYRRLFKVPLKTYHRSWKERLGILLRLIDERGNQSWGEIAPLSGFGSETFREALAFCQQLSPHITTETISTIPDTLPACQFGFESALSGQDLVNDNNIDYLTFSGLLPTGKPVLDNWKSLYDRGYRTLKWKIGVQPFQEEFSLFKQFIEQVNQTLSINYNHLPILLRLDANGGLTYKMARKWLESCDSLNFNTKNLVEIEFMEQPLSIEKFDAMVELSKQYSTPIALDESVASLQKLQDYCQQGWSGIFVIKPAIIGSPRKLQKLCKTDSLDLVFSSAFESLIGQRAALKLAVELCRNNRALGFGVQHWFAEDAATWLENELLFFSAS